MTDDRAWTVPAIATSARRAAKTEAARDAQQQSAEIFVAHAEELYRYIFRRCRNADEARDIVQDSFLKLYDALLRGEAIETPLAWLHTTSQRLLLDRVKVRRRDENKRRRIRVLAATTCPPEGSDGLEARERDRRFREGFAALSDIEQAALRGRAQGLRLPEIGVRVGVRNSRMVSRLIVRAIAKLRERCRE